MIKTAAGSGNQLRPHFKTHQSRQIGKWFRKSGVNGITVSSVQMAAYFAEDGWDDITIAFPVSIHEADALNSLTGRGVTINILAVDESTLEQFSKKMDHRLGIYIELDPNYGRSGIAMDDREKLCKLIKIIEGAESLSFSGFYMHAGHTYSCRSAGEVRELIIPILNKIKELKSEFQAPVCFGDTPSCSVINDLSGIDQLSPGNFIFYDWTQYKIGSCTPDQIAVAMFCPVVAKYEQRNELLIHGGAVHFSRDSFTENGITYYGVVAESRDSGWGNPLPENKLIRISQEHGTVQCTEDFFTSTEVGDIIPVLPIHSCLTADCMGGYIDLDGNSIDHMKGNTR